MNKEELLKFMAPLNENIKFLVKVDGNLIPVDKPTYKITKDGEGLIVLELDTRDDAAPNLPVTVIYTDGACPGNPGPGGYAFGIRLPGIGIEYRTGQAHGETTNQRMEVTAALAALAELKGPHSIRLYSDSEYLIKTMNGEFRKRTNRDLWKALDEAAEIHNICWIHEKAGQSLMQVECDILAKDAAETANRIYKGQNK